MRLQLNFASTESRIVTKFQSNDEDINISFTESYVLPSEIIKTNETLSFRNGVLSVNTSKKVEDSVLPVTSAAVDTVVGNIDILLKTI